MSQVVKPGLSREKILQAAIAYADIHGLESLSMRKLADELGVKAMSLYNHIKNKDDLMGALVEQVIIEIPLPDSRQDWKGEMRKRGKKSHEVLMAHPWACMPLVSRINDGPNMLNYVNASLGCLMEAGFDPATADYAWNAMDNYIYGFTLQSLSFPFQASEYQQVAQAYLPDFPKEQWPYLCALTEQVANGQHSGIHQFEFGFEMILNGLEALLNKASDTD